MLRREKIGKQEKGDFFLLSSWCSSHYSSSRHTSCSPQQNTPTHTFQKISSQRHTQKKEVFIHPISFLNLTSLILFVNKEHHLYHHPPFLSIHSFISSSWHELLSHEKSCDERTYNKKVHDGNWQVFWALCLHSTNFFGKMSFQ